MISEETNKCSIFRDKFCSGLTTFSKGTDHHGDCTEQQRQSRGPSPAKPVDAHDGAEVSRELHGGGDHEGEVELEVEVGDVPHGGVEHAADDHEEDDVEHTDPSHCWGFKQIQICVVRPER